MKKFLTYFVLPVCLIMLLWSCGKTTGSMKLNSPDGKITINIKGEKVSFADPFVTDVQVKGYDKEQTYSLEVFTDELSEKNISVTWEDANTCILVFNQTDNEKILMKITVNETGITIEGN